MAIHPDLPRPVVPVASTPTAAAETLRQLAGRLPQQSMARLAPGFPGSAPLALALGRVHELCGPARRTLALILAGAAAGPVVWIAPGWSAERLHPPGFARFLDPGRLLTVACRRDEDLMWCAEEALRHLAGGGAGTAGGVVVAELSAPPGLTPVRRLHLAAAPGVVAATERRPAGGPLGLMLTPDAGGAPGVESRWQMTPQHPAPTDLRAAGTPPECWRLDRLRARGSGPGSWRLLGGGGGRSDLRMLPAGAADRDPPGTAPPLR